MRFLVDVNLPDRFSYFNTPNFEFVANLDERMTDTNIWYYALENDLVILTKDTDFYHRALVSTTRPKIVHFRLGNHSLKQLHLYFQNYWSPILSAIEDYDLVVAYPETIACIL
jgi:predicted nuclease of predicted toxin-antitoxin system